MNEILGSIFGYNYRRRILINLRKKRLKLRELNLLKIKKKREKEKKRKKNEVIRLQQSKTVEKDKVEENVEEQLSDEQELIEDNIKEESIIEIKEEPVKEVNIPKLIKRLELTKEKLIILEDLEDKYKLNDDEVIKGLTEEVFVSLEILKPLVGRIELKEEEKEIVKDIEEDTLIDDIIEIDKKEIMFMVLDKNISKEEVESNLSKVKDDIEDLLITSEQDIRDISNLIENGDLDIEITNKLRRGGLRKATRLLFLTNILSIKRPKLNNIVRRMFNRSLVFDMIKPKKKKYIRKEEVLPKEELEACRKDIDFARLSILDAKEQLDHILYELDKYKDIEEYKDSYEEYYKEIDQMLLEIINEEKELDRIENELECNEEYTPNIEEELLEEDDNLLLFTLLTPRPIDLIRTFIKRP